MRFFQSKAGQTKYPIIQPDEFSRFYEQAHLSVFRYAMVLCAGNQLEAEDITADAFFRAWQKREQFSGSQSAALGWVITIARNLLIDHRRAKGKHEEEAALEEDITDHQSGVEDLLVDREHLQLLLNAIHELPFPQGDMLTLRFVLGWQVKAIAEHFGLAENTVSTHLRRAIVRVQRKLTPQAAAAEKGARYEF